MIHKEKRKERRKGWPLGLRLESTECDGWVKGIKDRNKRAVNLVANGDQWLCAPPVYGFLFGKSGSRELKLLLLVIYVQE